MSAPNYDKIGFSLCDIDDDEWSWTVEGLRPGEMAWGAGSDVLAEGCERSYDEAKALIKAKLEELGVEPKEATQLPF